MFPREAADGSLKKLCPTSALLSKMLTLGFKVCTGSGRLFDGRGGGGKRQCTAVATRCSYLTDDIAIRCPPPPPLVLSLSAPPRPAPPGQRHRKQPRLWDGRPPGVVKQDKSSGGSVDTTNTRSGPRRVRMSSGERPIGAANGKQTNTRASCQAPPPFPPWSALPQVCHFCSTACLFFNQSHSI